ncbi:MAG: hypothetical protein ACT4P4_27735 [Betaproteobacteria bacterium]
MFRQRAADPLAIRNFIQESDDKAAAARKPGEKPGNRVDSAYDAVHMICLACLGVENYRTTAEQGHHLQLLEAICQRIGGGQGLLDRVEALMEARNRKYSGAGRTRQDAEDAVKVMDEFLAMAETWIKPRLQKLARN